MPDMLHSQLREALVVGAVVRPDGQTARMGRPSGRGTGVVWG